ncbi:SHOCT domain-containing protein [Virgibacillus alimentarius]|uniref:Membrane protein n=1 Tax=Virgibacillus alimentarius TaxID=698769 RepID=A0ABS4S6V8_9BACI|nr:MULTISPECIES: hypothetical protein [Virgibacillus]MBP2257216.1 putative membrane protein [Virgibacillus alimentarius]HLR67400.1 SHOCT domain-containing protein [Virgibacillus sp.]
MSILNLGYIRIFLSIIVFVVLVIILIRFRASKNPAKDSLDLLREKYERGELTKEEYEEARKMRE